jgi:hypothetical protein
MPARRVVATNYHWASDAYKHARSCRRCAGSKEGQKPSHQRRAQYRFSENNASEFLK